MRNRLFPRFFALALCLVLSLTLSAPALAADLGYQYEFDHQFTFSDFTVQSNRSWYAVNIGASFNPVPADGDYVVFSIDGYSFTTKFQLVERAKVVHYIGNAYDLFGYGDQNNEAYLLQIYPDNPELNTLYLRSDLFSPLFAGNTQKIHVTMSVAHSNMDADDVTSVFTTISHWLLGMLNNVAKLFWTVNADGVGSLTFLGVLSIVGLGISLALLLTKVCLRFLQLR